MLSCHLLTDQQAKIYARRMLNAMIESWCSKRENNNTNGKVQLRKNFLFKSVPKYLIVKRKTPSSVPNQIKNDIYIIELD